MIESLYSLDDFDFELPENLIAQAPLDDRDASRLFVVDRSNGQFIHDRFKNISQHLVPGDLLVMNNAKVIPARIFFKRKTGSLIEVVLARMLDYRRWMVICNRSNRLKPGEELVCVADGNVTIKLMRRSGDYFEIESNVDLDEERLLVIGKMPLPPYIKRDAGELDIKRYQTVYAQNSGAVASPTAGLHFTKEIIQDLQAKGVSIAYVTLYVSWGTFSPVRSDSINEHIMHSESFHISEETAAVINKARSEGRRIISVGTTSLRVLESTFHDGKNIPGKGETDIFIFPPFRVKSVSALITNFHTPKSTLLMLVSAFAGYDLIKKAYREAVSQGYRFFSYGDSMFICGEK
jgi:S-adenosylmethionine:tRNA ribosyltransferase-isomerase